MLILALEGVSSGQLIRMGKLILVPLIGRDDG